MALFPVWEEAPIVRLEYEAESTIRPAAHWQFHAERGALSFILARTHTTGEAANTPHSLSKLHLPVGANASDQVSRTSSSSSSANAGSTQGRSGRRRFGVGVRSPAGFSSARSSLLSRMKRPQSYASVAGA